MPRVQALLFQAVQGDRGDAHVDGFVADVFELQGPSGAFPVRPASTGPTCDESLCTDVTADPCRKFTRPLASMSLSPIRMR